MKLDVRACDKCKREFRGAEGTNVEAVVGRTYDGVETVDDWTSVDLCSKCLATMSLDLLLVTPLEARKTVLIKFGAKI